MANVHDEDGKGHREDGHVKEAEHHDEREGGGQLKVGKEEEVKVEVEGRGVAVEVPADDQLNVAGLKD